MDQITAPEPSELIGSRSIVQGLTLDDRDQESRVSNSWYQDGLEDGQRGIYDEHSFHRDRPLRTEERAVARLQHDLASAVSHQLEDEAAAFGIVEEARADSARASKALELSRQNHSKLASTCRTLLGRLTDTEDTMYVPDAMTRTSPATGSRKSGSEVGLSRSQWVVLTAVVAEAVLSFWASMILRDSMLGTVGFALVMTLVNVVLPILAGRNLRGAGSIWGVHKISALAALFVLVAVVAGSGWMRFVNAEPNIAKSLAGATAPQTSNGSLRVNPSTVAAGTQSLDPFGAAMLFILCVALPLAVAAMVLLAELTDRTAEIAEARTLRTELAHTEGSLPGLEAKTVLAQHTAVSAEHNFDIVVERTNARIRALPALTESNYLSYLAGLAHAMAAPAVTALLDDCAASFHERFTPTAEKLVNEYLDLVREVRSMPDAAMDYVDDSGRAVSPRTRGGHA